MSRATPVAAVLAATTFAAMLLAGCAGGGGAAFPRLTVGDGPPADQWGELPPRTPPRGGDTAEPTRGEGPPPAPAEPGPDPSDAPSGRLVVFEPAGDGFTFRVAWHADGADWSSVAVAAEAGDWTVVVDGGAGGEYPVGSGAVAHPEPWEIATDALLAFCDRSAVDGVTGTYVEVRSAGEDESLLRERIQGQPC